MLVVSKVTLDIICLTAFGYETDSLSNPGNELAEAYHDLVNLQSGKLSYLGCDGHMLSRLNIGKILALFMALVSVPGMPSLLGSSWLYNRRHWLEKCGPLAPTSILLNSMRRIKTVSASILAEAKADAAAVAASDSTLAGKKDVMSLLVQSRLREAIEGPGYRMTDAMMMEQVVCFFCFSISARYSYHSDPTS